jgi:hypothetical protein
MTMPRYLEATRTLATHATRLAMERWPLVHQSFETTHFSQEYSGCSAMWLSLNPRNKQHAKADFDKQVWTPKVTAPFGQKKGNAAKENKDAAIESLANELREELNAKARGEEKQHIKKLATVLQQYKGTIPNPTPSETRVCESLTKVMKSYTAEVCVSYPVCVQVCNAFSTGRMTSIFELESLLAPFNR